MSPLEAILGLTSESRVLVLGDGDLVLESALAHHGGGIIHSRDGGGLAPACADVAVIGRAAAADPGSRRALIASAARALAPGGVLAIEVPNRLAALALPLLAYEGIDLPRDAHGGLAYRAARRLVRANGFPHVSGFICLPSLADPRLLLPLDSRHAAAFHFRPPFFPETARRRLLRRVLGALAWSGVISWLAPAFGLIATRGGEAWPAEAA